MNHIQTPFVLISHNPVRFDPGINGKNPQTPKTARRGLTAKNTEVMMKSSQAVMQILNSDSLDDFRYLCLHGRIFLLSDTSNEHYGSVHGQDALPVDSYSDINS